MPEFEYEDLLPLGKDRTTYRLLTDEGVRTVKGPDGRWRPHPQRGRTA